VWGFTWGIKGANLETIKEIEKSGTVTLYAVLYLLALLASAAYSWALIRHPKKQWAIRSYTVVLFVWAAIFAGIAIKAPAEAEAAAEAIDF